MKEQPYWRFLIWPLDLEKDQTLVLRNLAKSLSLHFNVVCDIHIVDIDDHFEPVALYHSKNRER